MKVKLYLVLILSLVGWRDINAQEKFILGDPPAVKRVFFQPCYIKDSLLIGKTDLSVRYRLTRKIDDNLYRWCTLKLMIGNGVSSQIDELEYVNSLIMTNFNNGATDIDESLRIKAENMGNAPSNLFLQMVRMDKENTVEMICSDMQMINRTRMYREPVPDIAWVVGGEADSLYGYSCMVATARFRGRTWTAWFTMEIPIELGPWKLSGLPGLILKAIDESGEYCFDCVELSQTERPLFIYDYPNKQIIDRLKYLKYEKNSFTQPYELLANGEDIIIWERNSDGSVTEVKESWTIPYYPIELE